MNLNSLNDANEERKDAEDVNDDDDDDTNEAKGVNEDKDENEIKSEDEEDKQSGRTKSTTVKSKFAITFKDVEDSIRPFNGDEKYSMARWITDFEEAAELFEWTDMQKMIFAKRLLRELIKLFIQGERGLNMWKKLKKALQDEFSDKLNSAELHRQMEKRKIKKDKSVRAYFLAMREMAARGEIEEEALFQYVIDDIDDQPMNKGVLYGAKNTKEFKEKLKAYEKMRTKGIKSCYN